MELPHSSGWSTTWLKEQHDAIDWEGLWRDLELEVQVLEGEALRAIPFLRRLLDGYEECHFFHIIPHASTNFEKYLRYLALVGTSRWARALRGIGAPGDAVALDWQQHRELLAGLSTCPSFVKALETAIGFPDSVHPIPETEITVLMNHSLDVQLIDAWLHNHGDAKLEALMFCKYMFGMNWRDLICLETAFPWSCYAEVDASYLKSHTYLIANLATFELWLLVIRQLDD